MRALQRNHGSGAGRECEKALSRAYPARPLIRHQGKCKQSASKQGADAVSEFELPDDVHKEARAAWYRYLEVALAFRPQLHRYCRRLTGDIWDAEDLVQDTLLRGFAALGSVHHRIDNPRSYLLRIATNLWIDLQRRQESERSAVLARANELRRQVAGNPGHDSDDVRQAGAAFLERLAPRERAALLLKDVFDMTLEETAGVLGTTTGAVKSALHRGRSRLRDADSPRPRALAPASAELVDRFVERYNARDLQGLLALMLDSASIELFGLDVEAGRESFGREHGWFHHNFFGPPGWPAEQPFPARWERAIFQGEPIALVFNPGTNGEEVLGSVMRFEEQDNRFANIRAYALCPETVREVGETLSVALEPDPYAIFPLILAFARGQ
jgi:RNA polymerase sigma-70 factor (ECF subfamily)